jgi:hypothetical protein
MILSLLLKLNMQVSERPSLEDRTPVELSVYFIHAHTETGMMNPAARSSFIPGEEAMGALELWRSQPNYCI